MTLVEADHMRRLLDGVDLFRERLSQSEDTVSDLEAQVDDKEQAHRRLTQRAQRAEQAARRAREAVQESEEEAALWRRKQQQCAGATADHEMLSAAHASLVRDIERCQEALPQLLEERQGLRERLHGFEERTTQQVLQLQVLQAQCQQDTAHLRGEQLEELATLRAAHNEAFSRA